MAEKTKKYRMIYTCQMCGEQMVGGETDAPDGKPRFQLHGCLNGNFGIGMLTGFEVIDGKEKPKKQHTEG